MNLKFKNFLAAVILLIVGGLLTWFAVTRFEGGAGNRGKSTVFKKPRPGQAFVDSTQLNAFRSDKAHISLQYPDAFLLYRKQVQDTSGWSYSGTQKGRLVVQLKLPRSFQSKTNFGGAFFSVGWSDAPALLKQCLHTRNAPMIKTDTVARNGVTYLRSQYTDAGAGNYYQVTRYRTRKYHRCYSIEMMVHSTNIHNYPASRGISKFDSARVQKKLHRVMQGFRFL